MAHVIGVPRQAGTAFKQLCAKFCIASTVADVPLTARHNLERAITFFVELHGMGDGSWFANHLARCSQHLCDGGLCLFGRFTNECSVVSKTRSVGEAVRRIGNDASVARDDGAHRQLKFSPPDDVGEVTECAAHCDAGSLVNLCKRMRKNGDFNIEQRCANCLVEVWLVSIIVWMCNECYARSKKFWASGVNKDVARSV